ncbi:MAG: hypothetical protein M1825_002159 [Sarcosagium campestre]|nr:MAG: hypothetical protein M1825_002159 [Sarcosagium campestre]
MQIGNYLHGALYLENGDEKSIYEVTGEHPDFRKNVMQADPAASRRHVRNILVATIETRDIQELVETIDKVHVDNETVEWNCQDYVLETLEALLDECIIDEDDEDCCEGRKRAIDNYYGAL